jgi:uncharacterized protein (TIGR02117 family)
MSPFHVLQLALLALFLAGCASGPCYEAGAQTDALHSIYVVRRGWHTGILIAAVDWPDRRWALFDDFPESEYLEFGWGDERFYQARRSTPWLATRAVLWPTSSVIHVIGFKAPLGDLGAKDVVEVRVTAEGLRRLTAAIKREFAGERLMLSWPETDLAPAPNQFYSGRRSFYFPRMCNWWVARHLQEAGCPIQSWSVVTASRIFRDARRFGDAADRRGNRIAPNHE